jgi:hypothetical protein
MLKGITYTTFPPMMTSSSFDFRVYLKIIFALEPPRRQKRGQKNGNFFKIDIYVQGFFSHSKTFKKSKDIVARVGPSQRAENM